MLSIPLVLLASEASLPSRTNGTIFHIVGRVHILHIMRMRKIISRKMVQRSPFLALEDSVLRRRESKVYKHDR